MSTVRAFLLTATLIATSGAWAQTGVIADPIEMEGCLCLEQRYQAESRIAEQRRAALAQAQREAADMDARLAQMRRTIGTSGDPEQVEAARALSARRIALGADINNQLIPALNGAVGRYNASASRFRAGCATRGYDTELLEKLRPTLVCPPLDEPGTAPR